jgi:hypothetical protein
MIEDAQLHGRAGAEREALDRRAGGQMAQQGERSVQQAAIGVAGHQRDGAVGEDGTTHQIAFVTELCSRQPQRGEPGIAGQREHHRPGAGGQAAP